MLSRALLSCLAATLCILILSHPILSEETEYPLTISDSAGRTITIPMPVQRIIALSTDHAEAVMMLGDGDKIVGVSDNLKSKVEIFPSLKNKQGVGKWNEVNFEQIGEIARQGDTIVPDIIVLAYTYPDKPYGAENVAMGLKPFGNITVVGLDFYKPENLTQDVQLLGKILNRNDEAQDYLDWLDSSRTKITNAIKGDDIPNVYFESNNKGGLGELATYGMGSGIDGMIRQSGGINIAGDLEEMYPKVTWEWVITQNPSAIIRIQSSDKIGWDSSASQDTTTLEGIADEIIGRAGGEKIPAISDKDVHVIYWDMMFGMDSVVGQTYLAKILHPDADLHPKDVYREYLKFLGIEFPEERIFVYPPLDEN